MLLLILFLLLHTPFWMVNTVNKQHETAKTINTDFHYLLWLNANQKHDFQNFALCNILDLLANFVHH